MAPKSSDDLHGVVRERLEADGLLQKPWSRLLFASLHGRDVLAAALDAGATPDAASDVREPKVRAGAYLASIAVQGFRGIGPKTTLSFTPGPGLTLVVGRNGSGKSSFAEALEVLVTGDSKRWSERSKIWKEGWRNLHQPHPASIEAEVLLEGQGPATIVGTWDADADLEQQQGHVQPRGKRKTTLQGIGWKHALVSHRPFLSYNELGSMLDEGPSKLYDALSLVLGLEDLITAQEALGKARLERQRALDAADQVRKQLIDQLTGLLAQESDDRASDCLTLLSSKSWGLDALEGRLAAGAVPSENQDTSVLTRVLALETFDAEKVTAVTSMLRDADAKLKAMAGTDAEISRHQATLLEQALAFHAAHGGTDCPVCGNAGALNQRWADASRKEIDRLNSFAASTVQAHRDVQTAVRSAKELLPPPPRLLEQVFEIGLDGLAEARKAWAHWHRGAPIDDLPQLAEHMEASHEPFVRAIEFLKKAAAAELQRREDRWRPIGNAISAWIEPARAARVAAEHIPNVKAAEAWLKEAAAEIRNQRFAPIADQAMAVWLHLRQQSNVDLGRIELTGAKAQRRVALDVTVDGVRGAALGVMSQGELHALALSLFLPRATLPESPFRFVVIDDPVQSMDPARVDGLARALEETARTRQVIVFTHDDRLPEAVRRLNITAHILSVTRRPQSVVEVRRALDPVKAHVEDALALVHTTDLPRDILRRLVPGFCRSALEAAFLSSYRRRHLAAGRVHGDVEDALREAGKLTTLAALALFDDKNKGGDVMKRLNHFGPWAGDVFKQCNSGVHEGVDGDLHGLVKDTEQLADKILELR